MSRSKDATAYPELTKQQRSQLVAATNLYAAKLDDLAKGAKAVGKSADATAYETEAEQVREEIVAKLDDETPALLPRERVAVAAGIALFVKNLRSAKGTVRGLGKDQLAEEFEEEAMEVQRDLVPMFSEQTSLKGV